jgi:hypothetical protein
VASYEHEHARALASMQRRGAQITFPATSGTYDGATGTWSEEGGAAEVSGWAVEKPLEPEEYQELKQITKNPVLLVFVPTTYGERPVMGQRPMWAGRSRTVAGVLPIRPAEEALAARVVLG